MSGYYSIKANNAQEIIVWSHEYDCNKYVESLNEDREFNHYEWELLPESMWSELEERSDIINLVD